MAKAQSPFLIVNPKSYLYGKESLELAKAADQVAKDTGLQIYFTCPYADIRMIKENTTDIIVCAQSMDPLDPGRGMGHVLPESLKEAGADFSNVVKTTVFIKDMNEFAQINEVYAEYFGENKPARACVEVARLPKDVKVEIELIAVL
mgnify:CR=1 FL=1